jgi:dipeptidyl aminopeptidase/acylaminoacyl peptidase
LKIAPPNRTPSRVGALGFVLVLIGLIPAVSVAVEHASADAFGHLPNLENVILSPDGTKIAFINTSGDERNLLVLRVGETRAFSGAHAGDVKVRKVQWMDDNNLLITTSLTSLPPFGFTGAKREWSQLVTYNLTSNKLAGLNFEVPDQRTLNVLSGDPAVRMVDGKTTLYAPGLYVRDQTLPALFRFSIGDSRTKMIATSYDLWTDWLVDESGRIAVQYVYRDEKKSWEIKSRKDDRMITVASGTATIDVPFVLGFDFSGDSVLVQFIENGDPVWKPLLLKDGSWGPALGEGEAFTDTIEDRKTGRIIGGCEGFDESHCTFFDAELQAHWNAVLRAFPGERVDLVSNSDDFSKIVVRVFGEKDGYVYCLFDWYTHRAHNLGSVYRDVVPAPVRRVSYQAADGMTIPGFLTVPRGAVEKNLPLIVMPHGGPAAADTLDFDWWAQALAAQGYAVLQPNYRGSDLGHRFVATGFGEWGRKMQTDLSDGVRYLAHEGIVDPNRVCIVGASYGGYAALAGATLDARVYRCAVSVAGISDLKRFLKWTNDKMGSNDNLSQRYWDRFMGVSSPNDPALNAISPIEHVSAVSAPILLIHGRDDTVVPYEQSDVMADALKHAGKSVEMIALKHEDHWLSRSATRQQMLAATVAFLQKNNPAD